MKRFKNIIYHADGEHPSNESLQRAVSLAQSNDARLTVMDVIQEMDSDPDINKRFGTDLTGLLLERRLEQLEAMLEPYANDGIPIYTQVTTGTPFIELIKSVLRNNFDLLMKAPHPSLGLTERLFYGSFDLHLLRKCPCPVWIDRPESAHPYNNIIAAVDPGDPDCAKLNHLIMDLATSLADRESAQLHVVHAWRLPGESMLISGRARISKTELEQLLRDTEHRHRRQLNELLQDYGLSSDDPGVRLVKEMAPKVITSVADQVKADLIVMGTVGRTGLSGLIIGNTAEDILQASQTSIMAVKPEGFVSPVSLP